MVGNQVRDSDALQVLDVLLKHGLESITFKLFVVDLDPTLPGMEPRIELQLETLVTRARNKEMNIPRLPLMLPTT